MFKLLSGTKEGEGDAMAAPSATQPVKMAPAQPASADEKKAMPKGVVLSHDFYGYGREVGLHVL